MIKNRYYSFIKKIYNIESNDCQIKNEFANKVDQDYYH